MRRHERDHTGSGVWADGDGGAEEMVWARKAEAEGGRSPEVPDTSPVQPDEPPEPLHSCAKVCNGGR